MSLVVPYCFFGPSFCLLGRHLFWHSSVLGIGLGVCTIAWEEAKSPDFNKRRLVPMEKTRFDLRCHDFLHALLLTGNLKKNIERIRVGRKKWDDFHRLPNQKTISRDSGPPHRDALWDFFWNASECLDPRIASVSDFSESRCGPGFSIFWFWAGFWNDQLLNNQPFLWRLGGPSNFEGKPQCICTPASVPVAAVPKNRKSNGILILWRRGVQHSQRI